MPEFREGRFCIPLCKDGSVWPSLPVSGIMPHQFAWKSLVLVITERGALLFFATPPPPFALRSGELRLVNILLSEVLWPGAVGVRACHTIAALWLLLRGWEDAAGWSDICKCQW